MAQLERFFFDTDFDAQEPEPESADTGGDSGDGAEEAEPEGPAPEYFEEDVQQARDQGYSAGHAAGHADGLEAGRQDAQAQADQALADALDRVAGGLDQVAGNLGAAEERRDREALQVAVKLVEKLFPALDRRYGLKEIEALISDSLNRLREQPRVVVRVAPNRLEALQERIEALAAKAGYEGKVMVISDAELPDGDVRVEWAEGGAERDTERLWREIDAAITRTIEPGDGASTAGTADAGASGQAEGAGGTDATSHDGMRRAG
jgi:flagellar assembly protein FliH